MKTYPILLLLFFCFACTDKKPPRELVASKAPISKNLTVSFQSIIESADLKGGILLVSSERPHQFYSNDFRWAEKGHLPASTYKIPNSIIALEAGVVADDSTHFKWDGERRAFKLWEQDLIFKNAFKYSCVPCYREVAREIGLDRMKNYLTKLDYGNIQVDSTTLDIFWLTGTSTITQFEQIDFLRRLYQSELPISKRTEKLVKDMMVIEENSEYKLSGKTGWSVDNDTNNGWFVGYVETKRGVHYFATNVEPKPSFDMDLFAEIRKEVTYEALRKMNILE